MTQSSFPFLFSSSFSSHRLVTLITILLLNPLPFIYAAPTQISSENSPTAVQRHKRDLYVDDDTDDFDQYLLVPDTELVFEGLIGLYSIKEKNNVQKRKEKKNHFLSYSIRLQI